MQHARRDGRKVPSMRFPALQTESVERPVNNYRGAGTVTWSMWHPVWTWAPFGARWQDRLTKEFALHAHEGRIPGAFTLWMYTEPQPEGLHFVYLSFPVPLDTETSLRELAESYAAQGTEQNGVLPRLAVPVLRRSRDGDLLRLWTPPGPDIPEVQRVKVEWATIRLTNRCYSLEPGADNQGPAGQTLPRG